ncbi:Integrase catalytic region [Rhizobium sp. CF080]|nr:Integrase catalytic region [Rhizobium sp. CF080]
MIGTRPVMDGLIQALQSLPHLSRRSITFDRGTEFTDWPYLQARIGTQTWFCDPQSPWQKSTVENTNGRVRKWLSREVDPLSVTDADLIEICNRLNATPRRCLGYRTPAEVFRKKLLAQMRQAGLAWAAPQVAVQHELTQALGDIISLFSVAECRNFFKAAGYEAE